MLPLQLIMNGQARAIEVGPSKADGEWVVVRMGSPRGQYSAQTNAVAIMENLVMRKCEVVTDAGRVLLRLLS